MSRSAWSVFCTVGQLSIALAMPSLSVSLGSTALQVEVAALSGQGSQASPTPSPSKSACLPSSTGRIGLNTLGQLSWPSAMPSPSLSVALAAPVYTVEPITDIGRLGTQVGSLSGVSQKK